MEDNYKELFLSESQEFLGIISKCLVLIEENPADALSINEIFLGVHTLKSLAATMGYDKFAHLCHQAEDLLGQVRSRKRKLTSETIDTLFATVDVIEQLMEEIKTGKPSSTDTNQISQRLKKALSNDEFSAAAPAFARAEKKRSGEAKVDFNLSGFNSPLLAVVPLKEFSFDTPQLAAGSNFIPGNNEFSLVGNRHACSLTVCRDAKFCASTGSTIRLLRCGIRGKQEPQ